MIESFSVGAVFKIINRASPTLTAILRQVRALNEAIEKARLSLANIGQGSAAGVSTAIAKTDDLAASWNNVAAAAGRARKAIGSASVAASRGGGVAAAAEGAAAGHGGGRGLFHLRGAGMPIPGGGHAHLGGAAGAAAGLLGYGIYEAMHYQDAVVLMAQHAGTDYAKNRDKYRKILMDAAEATGFGESDIAAATQQELRMFGGTGGPGAGIGVLPNMLRYAATETRLKGGSLEESMTALVGIAHMLQKYDAASVNKIMPAFSALSLRNPMSLTQQERAFGYAVPLLHSTMDLDPFQVMAASTALARAGITSTKAGTWIRSMMMGAMPGTSFMTKTMFKKHEGALRALGLIDANDKPTWFTGGKPDEMKFLETVSKNLPKIPVALRAPLLKALAGVRGAGAMAVLAEPAVRAQMERLYADTQDPANVNRVRNFMEVYGQQSSMQQLRTSLQTFNNTLADLGANILPGVNLVLKNFKTILKGIQAILPGGSKTATATVVGRATEGALIGAGMGGIPTAGIGAIPGAAIGVGVGALEGIAESYLEHPLKQAGKSFEDVVTRAAHAIGNAVEEHLKGALRHHTAFTGATMKPQPISLSLNVDGRTLAQSISDQLEQLYGFPTGAPSYDGSGSYTGGDDSYTDT